MVYDNIEYYDFYHNKEIGTYDYASCYGRPITDEEINELFGVSKDKTFKDGCNK